ncbi:hypothetical protein L7H23_09240 [Sphingopyxis sp. BSN-002]|uniref:hypothetical protein n=1 Tax=Sphingopyxis sp. BSN-002 TaxID=2911495 RepID=UPI001EDB89C9|nr:hypothetical protein [Sphingopyxis sp. BSN-002]UKK82764.1 hypothetical protein L7H23_09240 [Sphingopyxis sp. BSN-002]
MMPVAIAVLLLAATLPIKAERPFGNPLAEQKFTARLTDPLSLHEDQRCGDYDMRISMTLLPARPPRDIRIEAPDCAWERIAYVRKWLEAAPQSTFKPVRQATWYRFRVVMRLPR